MATKKQPTIEAKPQHSFVVKGCTFTSTPAEGTVECAKLIVQAALENAKALQSAAAMLKAPDCMLHLGN